MKKYYDAMYKVFYIYHSNIVEGINGAYRFSAKLRNKYVSQQMERMYGALSLILEYATEDSNVGSGVDFDSLLTLRSSFYDIIQAYFLVE
jgi:hypothetical protein